MLTTTTATVCWPRTGCWTLPTARGLLCGKMLADMGADVVQVEPPSGSDGRRIGPFYKDEPGVERSLFWWASCANKRGVTLDCSTADGGALLRRLIAGTDFLIESFDPGFMAANGLSYADLRAINSRLVMVSITAFRAGWAIRRLSRIGHCGYGAGWIHAPDRRRRPPLRCG